MSKEKFFEDVTPASTNSFDFNNIAGGVRGVDCFLTMVWRGRSLGFWGFWRGERGGFVVSYWERGGFWERMRRGRDWWRPWKENDAERERERERERELDKGEDSGVLTKLWFCLVGCIWFSLNCWYGTSSLGAVKPPFTPRPDQIETLSARLV